MSARSRSRTVRRAGALVFLLVVWEAVSRLGWVDPFYAPPPSDVAGVMFTLFADASFWMHLEATFV